MKIILLILLLIIGCGIITKSNELTVKKEYFENGQLKSVYHYRNDMKHGEAIVYYPTGALKGETTFDNDELEGRVVSYYENGNKEIQGSYANGILKGNWIKYYDNGVVEMEGRYKMGIRDGVWNLYLINGDILEETIYKDGEKINRKNYRDRYLVPKVITHRCSEPERAMGCIYSLVVSR